MAAKKKRSYTLFMARKKHHKTGYFADLGRKGGNSTKKRHGSPYFSRIGTKGGKALARKRGK